MNNFIFSNVGSVRDTERALLKQLAAESKGIIVEIGGFQGRTSIELGRASKYDVYVIDRWRNAHATADGLLRSDRRTFLHNIKEAGLTEKIIPLHNRSSKVLETWDRPIGMLFIDGEHTYPGVLRDLRWIKWVVQGGIIAIHDYSKQYKDRVVKAVDEIKDSLIYKTQVDSLIVFEKP